MPAAPHILRLPLRNPGHDQKGHVLVAITPTESGDDDHDPESRSHSRSLDLELVATDSLKAYVMTCECRSSFSFTCNLFSGTEALILLPSASQASGQGQPYLWRRSMTCAAFSIPSHPFCSPTTPGPSYVVPQ